MRVEAKGSLLIAAKQNLDVVVLLLLLAIGTWFRVARYNETQLVLTGDFARDYQVAHKIISHHEFPNIGPNNSIYPKLYNSPFYYYFLSTILLYKDEALTLRYANILLQVASMVSLYLLARILFGKDTALLTGELVILNNNLINHSYYIWQPWAAQPFYYASFYFLARAYVYKEQKSIFISVMLYLFGMGMGLFGFPSLPIYLIVLVLCIKRVNLDRSATLLLVVISILIFVLMYLPVIRTFVVSPRVVLDSSFYVVSFFVYTSRVLAYTQTFLRSVFSDLTAGVSQSSFWDIFEKLTLLITGVWYALFAPIKRKQYSAIIALLILFLIAVASLVNVHIYEHHFVVGSGPFIILLSEVATTAFPHSFFGNISRGCAIASLFILTIIGREYINRLLFL